MIPIAEPSFGKEELRNVIECVKTGWISSQGKFVKEFEDSLSGYVVTKYGVATSSGTTALHLALLALGTKPGDEVIVPTLTFIATANVARYCGATPVFVDSHPDCWCIDPDLIEAKITDKTVGIIPVHLYGHSCDMEPILDIAMKHNLWVVEDSAEAIGAKYKGRKVGSMSHISCFSFFANKIITTGEGGMCLTNNEELAARIRILRDHGMDPDKRYWHNEIGYNYRMTNLQAAIGVAQLGRIDELINARRRVADWYNSGLSGLPITLPPILEWADPVTWQYTILLSDRQAKEKVSERLKEKNVEARPMFYPIHTMPPYKGKEQFPVAEDLSGRGLSLPSSPNLTGRQLDYICNCIEERVLEDSIFAP